ncbi:MAG TPA: N-acetylmuramoyl-L-alanine amidase [candidate division Zixibacteria bacterium]|nr:N-acetylmuramoyl-L-alanine amidase [candidate division Zixibacteria bacterium]
MNKIVLLLVLTFLSGFAARADEIDFQKGEGKSKIQSVRQGEMDYLLLNDLASALGGQTAFDPQNQRATLSVGGHTLEITVFSPFVVLDKVTYNLSFPPLFDQGSFWLPAITSAPVLERMCGGRLFFSENDKVLRLEEASSNILDIYVTRKQNGTLLEIVTAEGMQAETYLSSPWLNVTIFGGRLVPSDFDGRKFPPLVAEVRAYQFDNSAQLAFRLARPIGNYRQTLASDPFRVQVALEDTSQMADSYIPPPPPPKPKKPALAPVIRKIVVDAGHGGEDHGAIGKKKTKEKDVCLAISHKLKKILENDGQFEVILTRENDTFIPLGDRTKTANDAGADLFISIHANANRKRHIAGITTYFLDVARNDESRALAVAENASIRFEQEEKEGFEAMDDLSFILLDMVQNEHQKESEELSKLIQRELADSLRIPDRGVDQAGFFVLNRVYMPAVLVETAFISNPNEEKLLRKGEFQEKIARGIYRGVLAFKGKVERQTP